LNASCLVIKSFLSSSWPILKSSWVPIGLCLYTFGLLLTAPKLPVMLDPLSITLLTLQFFIVFRNYTEMDCSILQHVEPLLGNDHKRRKYNRAVAG
jgi:hypothetical protein